MVTTLLRKTLPLLRPRVVVFVIVTLLSLPDLGERRKKKQKNICYQNEHYANLRLLVRFEYHFYFTMIKKMQSGLK